MADIETMKNRLEQMLADVTAELQTLGVQNPDVAEDWEATPDGVATGEADPNIGADRVEDWDTRRATLATLETRFNNIKRALQKITDGTYGTCEISGEPIEEDRLEANPAARTCKAHINNEADLPQT